MEMLCAKDVLQEMKRIQTVYKDANFTVSFLVTDPKDSQKDLLVRIPVQDLISDDSPWLYEIALRNLEKR